MQAPAESGLLYKSASDPVYGPLGLAQWVSVLRVTLPITYPSSMHWAPSHAHLLCTSRRAVPLGT